MFTLFRAAAFSAFVMGLSAAPDWLNRVAPLMTSAEKKAYLSLRPAERIEFERNFWTDKAIPAAEYFQRLDHADAAFGSDRIASGANTDPGRVYLSLGPPARITRLASSRVFVPLEIWYYDTVPGLLNTELRLVFYQPNSIGLLKLYSPTLDTIRALLLPQAGTRGLFGPNASITESSVRQNLKVGPAEDEVITASVNVATGIRATGNDEILGRITSPAQMLGKTRRPMVTSRFVVARPKLETLDTPSPYGGRQLDLQLETAAGREVELEVLQGSVSVYHNRVHLNFPQPRQILYSHRLDLLPGAYRMLFTIDGAAHPYPLEIQPAPALGEIVRLDQSGRDPQRRTAFEFDGKQLELNAAGRVVGVALAHPGSVAWTIRSGTQVLFKTTTEGRQIGMLELSAAHLAAGAYSLEAAAENETRTTALILKPDAETSTGPAVVRFNGNLAPAARLAFIGHQWLLRGQPDEARRSLQASLAKAPTAEAHIELARVDALTGALDAARDRVRSVLARQPNNFEALSVFAYIEAQLQDYPVAAEAYRRALGVQDSPALRAALAKLPAQ